MLKRYVHGIDRDDPLVSYDGSSTTSPTYLFADECGSIMAETNSAGTLTNKHQYGPYGEPINQSASRFRYTGQILLPGTALYQYKARVYHPKFGCVLLSQITWYPRNSGGLITSGYFVLRPQIVSTFFTSQDMVGFNTDTDCLS